MTVITLQEAECKECYRCVRECSVKAIKINDGQAEIVKDKCISCGHCVEVCPQNAKRINSDIINLKKMLGDHNVVASIAPSFITAFDYSPLQLVTALKKVGVFAVEETARGAQIIADRYNQLLKNRDKPLISACCPAIVNLVEKHYPELISYLSPTVSPMVAHAELIKEEYKDVKVVFIGPCIAKFDEMNWSSSRGAVDLVITFDQLQEFFSSEGIECNKLPESQFDNRFSSWSRSFPVENGVLKSAGLNLDLTTQTLSVSGLGECVKTFEDLLAGEINPKFIEAMVCQGGCINGPGISSESGINSRKEKVIKYTTNSMKYDDQELKVSSNKFNIDTTRTYINRKVK